MSARTASIARKTRETEIALELDVDGQGAFSIETGVPFLNHMLEIFSRHSLMDLSLKATGDTPVDDHHTVEDIGLVLGSALDQALGDRKGIVRYGSMLMPMDDCLSRVTIDLGGRPYLLYDMQYRRTHLGSFDLQLVEEFFRAFTTQARMNLHMTQLYGIEAHHAVESAFKGVARALRSACALDPRETGVPSSKGSL